MRQIKLNHFNKSGNVYSVSLGNNTVHTFKSLKATNKFLSDSSKFLTEKLHFLNNVYSSTFNLYRQTWLYFILIARYLIQTCTYMIEKSEIHFQLLKMFLIRFLLNIILIITIIMFLNHSG